MPVPTFNCAHCQATIDADSFFCDQCGKEINCCSVCGRPGNKTFCVYDGKPLVSAKQATLGKLPVTIDLAMSLNPSPALSPVQSDPLVVNQLPAAGVSGLTLINHTLNLRLVISSGDLISRNNGPHAQVFAQFPAVSGDRHVLFNYKTETGWCFEDQRSTNGTKHSTGPANWAQVAQAPPLRAVLIKHGDRVLIANVEFIVELPQAVALTPAPNATVRL